MYPIDNYNSIYQSKKCDKSKGSGIGMYIHKKYNFSKMTHVSTCTANLETLFVKITNTEAPVTVGVVYRPPNGDMKLFNDEFEHLLNVLPNKNVYISGDFNVNLHNIDNKTSNFEECFISSGYSPLISLATHEQPHCEKTCIDNIFCNSFDKIICSGTITDRLSYHLPIFSISLLGNTATIETEESNLPHYDYCNENVEKFIDKVKSTFSSSPEYNYNFSGFAKAYTDVIDDCCLSQSKPNSKRTHSNNPWITSAIINSISVKHELYKQWKKTTSKQNKSGNGDKYLKFKDYRKSLKRVIKEAKKTTL